MEIGKGKEEIEIKKKSLFIRKLAKILFPMTNDFFLISLSSFLFVPEASQ